MAGLSGAWGSREELLHPRDSHGRFRSKWKMAEGVVDAISNFLDRFNPRTFQSDNQASQYLFNRAKPDRFGGGQGYGRLHSDFDEANAHLRAGDIDAPTQKFVKMMDDSAVTTQDQLIISRTMGADSFGLTPQTLAQENGGIEDFTARLIGERGYTAGVIGTPMGHGPGKVTMSIAVPRGTKLIIPARSQTDRGVFFDKDQEFRVTKVTPDGRGGYYMMAIATPRTPGQTPEPIDNGPRGVGLTPAQREAGVVRAQNITAKRERRAEPPPPAGQPQIIPHQASPTGPTDTGPGGPPPRNEPIHAPSIGAGTPAPSEVTPGQAPTPQAPSAPEAPAAPTPDFRAAARDAGLQWPSDGARRKQFNNAYLGVVDGKKHPEDALRQLEADIRTNKDSLSRFKGEPQAVGNRHREGDIANLDGDIKKQEQLADLIAKQYGLQRAQEPKAPTAVKKAAAKAATPEVPPENRIAVRGGGFVDTRTGELHGATPITQAPGEKHRQIPGEAGARPVTNLEARRAAKAAGAPKLTSEQQRQVNDLSPEEQNSYRGFRGKGMTHGDALQSARDAVATRNAREAEKANKALTKKATPATVTSLEAARAKKAAGGMTLIEAKRRTAIDALHENKIEGEGDNSYKNILRNVEDGTWTPAKARQEAKGSAKHFRKSAEDAKGFGRATPEERQRIQDKNNAIADKYDKLETALLESESVTKTDKYRNPNMGKAPEAGAAKAVKKAAPAAPKAPADVQDIFNRLNEQDANNVPTLSRAQAAELVAPLGKAQLVEIAKQYSVPSPTSKTVPELKRQIVEAGVGRRLDSIAIRGFTGNRPGAPGVGLTRAQKEAGQIAGVPTVPAAGAAPNLDKMTKAELIAHARRPEISANIRTSMTKDQIKQKIRQAQEIGPPEPGSRVGKANSFKEAGLDKTVPELRKIAKDEGVPTAGLTRKEQFQQAILDRRNVAPRPMGVFSENRAVREAAQAEIDRVRALQTGPKSASEQILEPNAPAAQKLIQAPDRREAFAEDWINTPAMAKINEHTAAGRTITEVRDDILSGKITPDEGIRRLENDIELNKADLADAQKELRGDLPADERETVSADVDKLRKAISDQEIASSFMRKHFRQAPAVTPKEVEVQLDPEAKKLIDSAGPSDIREAAKVGGFGDLKGDTKDELLQDLVKKIVGKELASRAAKKAAPKKLAPAPLVTKKSSDPDYVDARAIAEGLGMDESDTKMLQGIQEDLDTGKETPAAIGRKLARWAEVGPGYRKSLILGTNPDNITPENQQRINAADAQYKRWIALADRLQKTRRRPARKATEPAPEKPKLTPEEKKVTAQAAEVLGVPKEQLQSRALAKKVAAAPPAEAAKSAVEQMRTMQSRDEGQAFLKNRTKAELQEIAKAGDISYGSKDTKQKIADQIVHWTIGRRLESDAISGNNRPLRGSETQRLEDMTPAQLADLEGSLGIKRVSLDRGDRIAAIRQAQGEQTAQASVTHSLPASGRQWNWTSLEEDGGVMHADSASMNLAQKLHKSGRESAARYIADMRYRISNPHGEHSPDDVEKMVSDLKSMMEAEQDPDIKALYRRALSNIDAPQSAAPKLPASTPPVVQRMMSELNQIPVARRSGHFAGTTKEVSAVDRLAELVRKVDSGDGGSVGTVQSELHRILRSFHESVDGAHQMWRLESLIDDPQIRDWVRSFYPKT